MDISHANAYIYYNINFPIEQIDISLYVGEICTKNKIIKVFLKYQTLVYKNQKLNDVFDHE